MSNCQTGFPKQFQAILNISGIGSWDSPIPGVKQLLYDYENLRILFDIKGWQAKQNGIWILEYKPADVEPDSLSRKQACREIKINNKFFVLASFARLCNIRYSS
jgi:hypothetical protein